MLKIDWDAIRAYASLVILTLVAFFGIWKDSKDYKKRAKEEKGSGIVRFFKQQAVTILYAVTFAAFALGTLDVHSSRHRASQEKADAIATQKANEKQIQDLQNSVDTGNKLLGQQRQDFLKQFTDMSGRVAALQTEVKTADLQKEAAQLSADLESTRKAMDVPKATLLFSFETDQSDLHVVNLPSHDGTVKVRFTVINDTDADALEGELVLHLCDRCKFVTDLPGFTHYQGTPDNERNYPFQHILAHSKIPTVEATIQYPPNAPKFDMAMEYRCRTCVKPKAPFYPLPPSQMGTVIIESQ